MEKSAKMLKRSAFILFVIELIILIGVFLYFTIIEEELIKGIIIYFLGLIIFSSKYLVLYGLGVLIEVCIKIEKNTSGKKDKTNYQIENKKSKKQNKKEIKYETFESDDDDEFKEMICPQCGYKLYFKDGEEEYICPHCGYKLEK